MTRHRAQKGFSLMEMAIVFGLAGMILGGVWTYASLASETSKVEQSIESINLTVENTRNVYAGQAIIAGGVATVMPFLVSSGAMPTGLIISTATSCSGAPLAQYASTAWGTGGDPCGSLRLCAWVAGIGAAANAANVCPLPASATGSQYIGVEFSHLNYASCLDLATRVTPTSPSPGLDDIYINGTSTYLVQGGTLPMTVGNAKNNCANSNTNIVDFIYALRAPPS